MGHLVQNLVLRPQATAVYFGIQPMLPLSAVIAVYECHMFAISSVQTAVMVILSLL
jgi:hypothetical protein